MARNKLVAGDIRYIVMFDDYSMRIPIVQTLVFKGEMTRGDGSQFLCFNEIKPQGRDSFFSVEHDQVDEILLDGSQLISLLKKHLI